jgi:hypothetical protein
MLQQRSSRKKLEASFSYPSGSTADWIDRDAYNLNVIVANCMLLSQNSERMSRNNKRLLVALGMICQRKLLGTSFFCH